MMRWSRSSDRDGCSFGNLCEIAGLRQERGNTFSAQNFFGWVRDYVSPLDSGDINPHCPTTEILFQLG